MPKTAYVAQIVLLAVVFLALPPDAFSQTFAVRIDELVAQKAGGALAQPADDAEFLRRVYLDLAGRIPSADEARAFLDDAAADKRRQLVDRLLVGPEYPRRMQELLHVMLMERLGDHPEWSRYLHIALEENRPWDEMAKDMLAPSPDDAARRGAAFWFSKRLENYGQNPVDLPALARDVGRLFLGADLQCAQCHDHLFIADYKQHDFQGLLAFVGHTSLRGDLPFPAINEGLVAKKADFMSVFVKEPRQTGPRLPGGPEVEIPVFPEGQGFIKPGVPRFSPLSELARRAADPSNPAFASNMANRLWWAMLGRGLVHPLDLTHSGNPASNPALLEALSHEFASHGFDLKWLLREIALSQAYQRSSLLPDGTRPLPTESFAVFNEKPLLAEQLMHSALEATGHRQALIAEATVRLQNEDPRLHDITAMHPAMLDTLIEEQLAAARKSFLAAFANPPREPEVEFAPSVKGALFVMNDAVVLSWLEPRPNNLVQRLVDLPDADAIAEELFLSVLSRRPSADERIEVATALTLRPDERAKVLGQLAWSLLASTEFCVNH